MIRLLTLALLAALAVSCGPGNAGSDGGPVKLRLWVFSTDVQNELNPVLREFEAQNPGIRVSAEQLPWDRGFEKILLSLATRRPPDVCELGMTWLAAFAEQDVLLPLDDVLAEGVDERVLLDASTYNGTLYAAPWMVGTRMLFFNRELLRRAGYEDPQPPTTWAELEEMSQRVMALGEPGVRAVGLPAGDAETVWQTFFSFLSSGRIHLLDPETRAPLLDRPEFLRTLEFYRGLKPYALVDRGPQLDRAFGSGRLAFHVSGAWNFLLLPRDYPTLDYGFAPMPAPRDADPGTAGGAMAGGQLLVVFRQSRHPEEALRLLEFLASKPVATRLSVPIRSILPAFQDSEEFPEFRGDAARSFHARMIDRAMAPNAVPYWEEMRRDLVTLLDTALLTDAPLDQQVERAQRHWTALAEEYR